MSTRNKRYGLGDLRQVVELGRVSHALAALNHFRPDAADLLKSIRPEQINPGDRAAFAIAAYVYAKDACSRKSWDVANHAFHFAAALNTANQLWSERARLTAEALQSRAHVPLCISLIEIQQALAIPCLRTTCSCNSHYEIARCKKLVGEPLYHVISGIPIHTVAPYYPYQPDRWTQLLRAVKWDHRADLLTPLGDVLADLVRSQSSVLNEVDVVVPVPPSTVKFNDRGFAPNDLLAERLSARLGLPVRKALVRKCGTPTAEASYQQLCDEFEVDAHRQAFHGTSVLLVEDIWTRGRTVPICASKLREFGATSIHAVALGKSS